LIIIMGVNGYEMGKLGELIYDHPDWIKLARR
jgi:hypothetical protein